MPYILDERRKAMQAGDQPQTVGELNYSISYMLHRFISFQAGRQGGLSYALLSSARAVLQDANDEFYRTVVAPYEDVKRAENGSVSLLDKAFSGKVKEELSGYAVVKALAAFAQRQVTPPTEGQVVDKITIQVDATEAIASIKNAAAEIAATDAAKAAENKPNVSTVRRASQVVGADPGSQDGTQRHIDVAAAEGEAEDGSVQADRPRTRGKLIKGGAPRGHQPASVSDRVRSVWDDATKGNGEDDVNSI